MLQLVGVCCGCRWSMVAVSGRSWWSLRLVMWRCHIAIGGHVPWL